MSDTKKLADMTPEELHVALILAAQDGRAFSVALPALIQRASREAREGMGMVPLCEVEEIVKQRDEARAQLAEAERKLASAGRERDLLNWILARCHVKTADGFILRTFDEAMDAHATPTPSET